MELKQLIRRIDVQPRTEKGIEFGEQLIDKGAELDFAAGSKLDKVLPCIAQPAQNQNLCVTFPQRDAAVQHKRLDDEQGIHLVGLDLADAGITQSGGLQRVDEGDPILLPQRWKMTFSA